MLQTHHFTAERKKILFPQTLLDSLPDPNNGAFQYICYGNNEQVVGRPMWIFPNVNYGFFFKKILLFKNTALVQCLSFNHGKANI